MKIRVFISWRSDSFENKCRNSFFEVIQQKGKDFEFKRKQELNCSNITIEPVMASNDDNNNTPALDLPEQAKKCQIFIAPLTMDYVNNDNNTGCLREFLNFIYENFHIVDQEDFVKQIIIFSSSRKTAEVEYRKLINILKDEDPGNTKLTDFIHNFEKNKPPVEYFNSNDGKFANNELSTYDKYFDKIGDQAIDSITQFINKTSGKKYPGLNIIDQSARFDCIHGRVFDFYRLFTFLKSKDDKIVYIFGPSGVGKSSFLNIYRNKNVTNDDRDVISPKLNKNIYEGLLYVFTHKYRYTIEGKEQFYNYYECNSEKFKYYKDKGPLVVDQLEGFLIKDKLQEVLEVLKFISKVKDIQIIISASTDVLVNILNSNEIEWKEQQDIMKASMLLSAIPSMDSLEYSNNEFGNFLSLIELENNQEHFRTAIWQHLHWVVDKVITEKPIYLGGECLDKKKVYNWSWIDSFTFFIDTGLNRFNICNCESASDIKMDLLAALIKISNVHCTRRYRTISDLDDVFKNSHAFFNENEFLCHMVETANKLSVSFNFFQGDMEFIIVTDNTVYFLHDLIPNAYNKLLEHYDKLYEEYKELVDFEELYEEHKETQYGEKIPHKLREKYNAILGQNNKDLTQIIKVYKRIIPIISLDYDKNNFNEKVNKFEEAFERVTNELSLQDIEHDLNELELQIPNYQSRIDLVHIAAKAFKVFYKVKHISNINCENNHYLNCNDKLNPNVRLRSIFLKIDTDIRHILFSSHGIEKVFDFNNSSDGVNHLVAHPIHKNLILSASYDSYIRITDISLGITKKIHCHTDENGKKQRAYACCFSPDGNFAVSCGYDGHVRSSLIKIPEESSITIKKSNSSIRAPFNLNQIGVCLINKRNIFVAVGGGPSSTDNFSSGYILYGFLDTIGQNNSDKEITNIGKELIFDFSWHPDNKENVKYFCTAGYDGWLRIYKITLDNKLISINEIDRKDAEQGLNHVKFTEDGNYVIASGLRKEILIYELYNDNQQLLFNKTKPKQLIGHRARVRKCDTLIVEDTKGNKSLSIVSCSSDSTVRFWNNAVNKKGQQNSSNHHVLTGHVGYIRDVLYSNDLIASVARDGKVNYWNKDGESLNSFYIFNGWGRALCKSSDEIFVASGHPNRICVFDMNKIAGRIAEDSNNITASIGESHSTVLEARDDVWKDLSNNTYKIDNGRKYVEGSYCILVINHAKRRNRKTFIYKIENNSFVEIDSIDKKENNLIGKGYGYIAGIDDKKINSHSNKVVIWDADEIRRCSLKHLENKQELRCALLNIESEVKYQIYQLDKKYFPEPITLKRPFHMSAAETYPVISSFSDCGSYLIILYEDHTIVIWNLDNHDPFLIFSNKLPTNFFKTDKINYDLDKESVLLKFFKPESINFYQLEIDADFKNNNEKFTRKVLFDIETTLPFIDIVKKLSDRLGIQLQNPLRENDIPYSIKQFLDKVVEIKITRPTGFEHKDLNVEYKHNYVKLADSRYISGDNKVLDVHLMTDKQLTESYNLSGKCVGYVHRLTHREDKLIVVLQEELEKWTRTKIQKKLKYYEDKYWEVIYYFSDSVKP